jgi:RHS repeat-associated protein
VWRWEQQEAFGINVPDENPSGLGAFELPLRFPGQYFDKETNLHYNYFRNYDPSLGRYEESDPIGLAGGINTYVYVAADPLRYVDPFGERRIKTLPNPFLNELRKQLPEFLIEQGAKAATTPGGFGQAVGRHICKATGGKVKSGFDACFLNGCDLMTAAGYEAIVDCTDACIDEIKKKCNPNCPR